MSWKLVALVVISLYFVGALLLYLLQERIIFLPEPTDPDFVYSFNTPFQEKFLEMDDGAKVNVLHFKPEGAKGVVVYYHGNAGNLERWGNVAEPLANMGFEILIMDYRGYGKSTGKRKKRLMLLDAEKVYQEALKDWDENEIIVYGRSLGSAFASHIGGKNTPSKIILEAPFHSVADMAKRMMPIYPVSWLLRFNFNNEKSLAECKVPVHIFHGNEDKIVPHESGKLLFNTISCEKHFYEIKGGRHNDLQSYDDYWQRIELLLNTNQLSKN